MPRLGLQRPRGRPFEPGHAKKGGRKKGTPNRVTRDIKELLASIVNEDEEYQRSLRRRMIAGKAAHMETLAAYYTVGKPREQVEVQTDPNLAQLLELAHKVRNERLEQASRSSSGASGHPEARQGGVDGGAQSQPELDRH